jgi:peptide/nickel transport system substrate-binding protein
VAGNDRSMWRDGVGLFCPGTPFSNDAGLEALTSPRDYAKVQHAIRTAGYNNERVVVLGTADYPATNALCQVGADTLRKCGFNVDYQAMDWASVQKRRTSKEPVETGGWNAFLAFGAGLDYFNPVSIVPLRADGEKAWVGWPTSARIEELRSAWIEATDFDTQKRICRDLQMQVWQDVPYIPTGQYLQPIAYNRGLTDILRGFPLFYNVRRAA